VAYSDWPGLLIHSFSWAGEAVGPHSLNPGKQYAMMPCVNMTLIVFLTFVTCQDHVWWLINATDFSRNEEVQVKSHQTFPQSSSGQSGDLIGGFSVCLWFLLKVNKAQMNLTGLGGLDITHAAL